MRCVCAVRKEGGGGVRQGQEVERGGNGRGRGFGFSI